jgi:signal transduction histidine kinase
VTGARRSTIGVVKWLAARAAALPPRLQDLVLAVTLAVVNVAIAVPYRDQLHPLWAAAALLVLQALPLVWRRRYPIIVLLVVGFFRSSYDQLGFGFAPLPLGPAIAYYTVMERCSTRMRLIISVLLVVGIARGQALPGHTEPYDFFIQLLIFASAGIAGLLGRTYRAYLKEVEARAERAEAERDQQAALAAARERTRIARELHDVVAHHVSLMAVQAEAADALLPGRPAEAGRAVQIIGEAARQALGELRRLLGVLRGPGEQPQAPPTPSLGELGAVLAQVREAGLAVNLAVDGSPGAIAAGVDLTAYRIVQEALTNALRHSAAASADVTIRYEPSYVTVSVTNGGPVPVPASASAAAAAAGGQEDPAAVPAAAAAPGSANGGSPDGTPAESAGATPAAAARAARAAVEGVPARARLPAGGFGLAGIAERVASCGGTLTVGPTEAGGFAVIARLPVL